MVAKRALWRQLAKLSPLIFVQFRSQKAMWSFQVCLWTQYMIWVVLVFSFLYWCQWIEERYLSINYICKFYWEFTEFGLVNRRQSAGWQIENHKSKRNRTFLHGPKKLLIVFDYCFWLFLCLSSKFSSRQNRKSKSMVIQGNTSPPWHDRSRSRWYRWSYCWSPQGAVCHGCSSADIPPSNCSPHGAHAFPSKVRAPHFNNKTTIRIVSTRWLIHMDATSMHIFIK
jgi:hypothetical protein